jgi:predicted kinase
VLVVLTGLPGTGKSTLARAVAQALPAAYLSVDPISAVIEQQPSVADPLGKISYQVVQRVAELQVGFGLSAVVDAVNPFAWVRQEYRDLAQRHGSDFALIYLAFSDTSAHRARVETRAAGGPGLSWSEVENQIAYYEPSDDFALQLDASSTIETNTRLALAVAGRSG